MVGMSKLTRFQHLASFSSVFKNICYNYFWIKKKQHKQIIFIFFMFRKCLQKTSNLTHGQQKRYLDLFQKYILTVFQKQPTPTEIKELTELEVCILCTYLCCAYTGVGVWVCGCNIKISWLKQNAKQTKLLLYLSFKNLFYNKLIVHRCIYLIDRYIFPPSFYFYIKFNSYLINNIQKNIDCLLSFFCMWNN